MVAKMETLLARRGSDGLKPRVAEETPATRRGFFVAARRQLRGFSSQDWVFWLRTSASKPTSSTLPVAPAQAHPPGEHVEVGHPELLPVVAHAGVHRGQRGTGLVVHVELVGEAAEQASAVARDLHRVQREVLLLGHLDRHGAQAVGDRVAAEGPAAHAHPAHHPGLVAHPDLAQLDAHLEGRDQVAHQVAEVDALLGREEEQDLLLVQEVVRAHQLHVEAARGDPLARRLVGLLLAHAVLAQAREVDRRGGPHHRPRPRRPAAIPVSTPSTRATSLP